MPKTAGPYGQWVIYPPAEVLDANVNRHSVTYSTLAPRVSSAALGASLF